ncbi:hypothetical protein DEU40_11318 [Chryseobacterium sp. AG844]|nr:hypothetical protein DEU40_11318 [Chryseobacterium sp. AG844]
MHIHILLLIDYFFIYTINKGCFTIKTALIYGSRIHGSPASPIKVLFYAKGLLQYYE